MGHHTPRADAEIRYLAAQNISRGPRRNELDVHELREENEQLRTLVIELSRIVARNVLERK